MQTNHSIHTEYDVSQVTKPLLLHRWGGPNVTITHDTLDLTTHGPSPEHGNSLYWDSPNPGPC